MCRQVSFVLVIPFVAMLAGCKDGNSTSTPSAPTPTSADPSPTDASAFGAGTHLVGQEIAPRRYFSDPMSGCYWARLSGLGGTLEEIIANEFIGFDSRQEIVAVLDADLAFQTDSECGGWFTTPRHGTQSNIPPGVWLVGSQVTPGTYRAAASDGCYWEKLRNFTGELNGIIANDFVAGGGTQLVAISSGDLGFSSDADCGTWTRVQTLATENALSIAAPDQSLSDIENNRRMNRKQEPNPF